MNVPPIGQPTSFNSLDSGAGPKVNERRHTPDKAESILLAPFVGLPLSAIVVPSTKEEFEAALAELEGCEAVGFDTESKPTFRAGEISDGPHVVQLATPERAYIFQLHHAEGHAVVARLLETRQLVKAGFGLKSDLGHLHRKLGVKVESALDLDTLFRAQGYRRETGVRSAVAILFNQAFRKSKRISTSNWAQPRLNERQLLYAANDAYAAIRVFMALNEQPGSSREIRTPSPAPRID